MQAILDNITAVIVSASIMMIFAFLQIRGTQTASEATINHMVYADLMQTSFYLKTDLENMRSEAQTDEAINRSKLSGGSAYNFQLQTSGGLTTSFTFPTLKNPATAYTLADPDDAEVQLVTYQLTDTGETLDVPEGHTSSNRTLYSLDRMVDGVSTGGSKNFVTHFLVELANKGSANFSSNSGTCPSDLAKVRFEFKLATEGIEMVSHDQQSTSQTNVSRYGATIDLSNLQ